jgi:hypothetical protein
MIKCEVRRKFAARAILASFVFCTFTAVADTNAHGATYTQVEVSPQFSPYNTELFNLLLNKKNIIDGINRFNKNFSKSFDDLLYTTNRMGSKTNLPLLRKKLLSGPEPKPVFVLANGKKYFYYEACQAHACNVTNLSLLYDVETRSMRAELLMDGVVELLGDPTPTEIELLHQLKSRE